MLQLDLKVYYLKWRPFHIRSENVHTFRKQNFELQFLSIRMVFGKVITTSEFPIIERSTTFVLFHHLRLKSSALKWPWVLKMWLPMLTARNESTRPKPLKSVWYCLWNNQCKLNRNDVYSVYCTFSCISDRELLLSEPYCPRWI